MGVGPCETGSEGGNEARASLDSCSGSGSEVRSMMEEMDCLVERPLGAGLGTGDISCGPGVSCSFSGRWDSGGASVFTR